MHIPDSMLSSSVCSVTLGLTVSSLAFTAYHSFKTKRQPTINQFASVSAFIFAAQMINFPVLDGTSGHLIGGVLAVSSLGLPFGILAVSLVLAIQSIIFADGGMTALGANILNMAIIPAIVYWGVSKIIKSKPIMMIAISAWLSVVAAAMACSLELFVSNKASFILVLSSMISVHTLIGLGEAGITVLALNTIVKPVSLRLEKSWQVVLASAVVIGMVVSPFASSFPDGLEWVAVNLGFESFTQPLFVTPLADYSLSILSEGFLSTSLAGLIGIGITFLLASVFGRAVKILQSA